MIARVTLELASCARSLITRSRPASSRKWPWASGSVPFGARKVLGCVTALAGESGHANLKSILKVIGAQTLVTPRVLNWPVGLRITIAATGSRVEKCFAGGGAQGKIRLARAALCPRAFAFGGELPKLPTPARGMEHHPGRREMPLQELLELAETTASTVRRLEDRGLVGVATQISERDPYAREHILPSQPLPLNPAQSGALSRIVKALEGTGVRHRSRSPAKIAEIPNPQSAIRHARRSLGEGEIHNPFLLHGVTGSGKTEVYLQAAQTLDLAAAGDAVEEKRIADSRLRQGLRRGGLRVAGGEFHPI